MTYRDDLEAALERADQLERDLEREHSAHARDEQKIAELEKQLAAARREAKQATTKATKATKATKVKASAPAPAPPPVVSGGNETAWRGWRAPTFGGLAVAAAIVGALVLSTRRSSSVAVSSSAPPAMPATPATPCAPRPPSAPLALDHFDVSGGYFAAVDLAHREFPDAELRSLSADFVDERGLAQLNYGGEARYRFLSPSRAAAPEPPSNLPLGVPHPSTRPFCRLSVRTKTYGNRGDVLNVSNGSDGDTDCGTSIAPPRCTLAQVWQEARKLGAPAGALAQVKLDAKGWWFRINDNGRDVFARTIPDSCAP